jgi:hypothetical protein
MRSSPQISRYDDCSSHELYCKVLKQCVVRVTDASCRLNEQVQQLLGSQAKLLEARVHAATQQASEQQTHQERSISPLQKLPKRQQQQQQQQHSQGAAGGTASTGDGLVGTSMQDFELQLQQLQLQVDNMGGQAQPLPSAALDQAASAAGATASGSGGARSPTRCSQGPAQQLQQQQLIADQAATIADLKKVIAGEHLQMHHLATVYALCA